MKCILVPNDQDYDIVCHHIKLKEKNCIVINNTIDFNDEETYLSIRKFMNHTRIKFKINKIKEI